jgi:hypothetical protein
VEAACPQKEAKNSSPAPAFHSAGGASFVSLIVSTINTIPTLLAFTFIFDIRPE